MNPYPLVNRIAEALQGVQPSLHRRIVVAHENGRILFHPGNNTQPASRCLAILPHDSGREGIPPRELARLADKLSPLLSGGQLSYDSPIEDLYTPEIIKQATECKPCERRHVSPTEKSPSCSTPSEPTTTQSTKPCSRSETSSLLF